MEETKERVKARSAASTEVATGSRARRPDSKINGCFNQSRARQLPC